MAVETSNGWTPSDYVGLANGILTAGAQVYAADMGKRSRKAYINLTREMAAYNNEMAEKHWMMQNEYNSPSAVMSRYKEAGLNPYLVYGNMENSAGSISTPQAEVPNISEPVGLNPFKALSDSIVAYQQIVSAEQANTNAKIQQDILAADAQYRQARAELETFKAQKKEERYNMDKTLADTKNQQAAFDLLMAQRHKENQILSKLEKEKQEIESMRIGDREKEARTNKINEEINVVKANVKYLEEKTNYVKWQMEMGEKRYNLDAAEAADRQYWRGMSYQLKDRALDQKGKYQDQSLRLQKRALGYKMWQDTRNFMYQVGKDNEARKDKYYFYNMNTLNKANPINFLGAAAKVF